MFKQILAGDFVVKKEIVIGVILLVVIYLASSVIQRQRKKYPPGPYGLPILGYAPFMTDKPYLKFIELSKKYGDIFSINLGYRRWIVVNSAEAIKEALHKPELLSRPPYGPLTLFKKESPFFTSPIHVWQEQRKFVVQSMKDLGLGKSKIEEHVKEEICAFMEVLKSHGGKPMNVKDPLGPSMSNNITALVFGLRYDYEHPNRVLLDKNADTINKYIGKLGLPLLFPWLKSLYNFKGSKLKMLANAFESSHSLFRKYISRQCLFGAGSETVLTSVLWCVYIMAAYPDLQKRVQKEIMDVIGIERMAELLDQKSMPYTHATILEVLRFVTIVPLNFLHYTTVDTTIKDYFIPRNTAVMANFWAVHHDPKNWEDPDSFKPERFLSEDRKTVLKPPNYMPFSLGRRACPGEAMAYMEIFLYFVTVLQKFDIAFPDDFKPSFATYQGLSLRPEDFKIRFLNRSYS